MHSHDTITHVILRGILVENIYQGVAHVCGKRYCGTVIYDVEAYRIESITPAND